ncbi:hypothetical protein C0L75_03095 [Clostridium perfringens]
MKKIYGSIYVHKSNVKSLDEFYQEQINNAIWFLSSQGYPIDTYEVIKINTKKISITFIESEDWDVAREPVVGQAYRVDENGDVRIIKQKSNPQIYHHKWMFVGEDYKGFDLEESKRWSEQWQKILPNTKEIKSRIGYKKYWEEFLKDNNLK